MNVFCRKRGLFIFIMVGRELFDRAIGKIEGSKCSKYYNSLYIFSNKAPGYLEDTSIF
jgi:hypothetical protein